MDKEETPNRNKNNLYIIIGILLIVSIAYRLTQSSGFNNSSILFVGIPALLSLLIIKYSGTPESTFGLIFKVITLFLLMSGIVLGEGIICIVIAAPIFYLVGFLIALTSDYLNKNDKLNSYLIVPLVVILAQPFGINKTSLETVSTSVSFDHTISLKMLKKSPDIEKKLPVFFELGFPKPVSINGSGMNIGDQRQIEFLSTTKGIGTLTLEIEKIENNSIHFKVVSDDTHIGSWLTWKHIRIDIDEKSTVTWTSDYTCDLGPQWYFEPIEKRAVSLMNKHLIQSYFAK